MRINISRLVMALLIAFIAPAFVMDGAYAASTMVSAANQEWSVGQVDAPMQVITWTEDGATPVTTSLSDLRVRIPTAFNCTWDTSDTTPTFGGTASGKVSPTVTYLDSGKTMLIWVNSDFLAAETLTIAGVSFTSFTAVSASDNLEIDIDADGSADYTDSATIEITTAVATNTPTAVPTATPTATPVPTNTPTVTNTPVPTNTPTTAPTATPTAVYSAIPVIGFDGRTGAGPVYPINGNDTIDRPQYVRLPNWTDPHGPVANTGTMYADGTKDSEAVVIALNHKGWVSLPFYTATPTPTPTSTGTPYTATPTSVPATVTPTPTASPVSFSTDVTISNAEVDYDTNADDGFDLTRDQAVTTKPLLKVTTDNVLDDQPAISVDHQATGAVDAMEIENDGTAAAIHTTGTVAGGIGWHLDVADSQTGRAMYLDLGPWLGTPGQGAVEVVTDSAATVPAGVLGVFNQQGTGQHAAAIDGSVLQLKDAATAPGAGTSYVMDIEATNIEALHVDSGNVQFDEGLTVTGTITGGTLTDGTVSFTGGAVTGMTGVTGSMMTADTVGADQLSDTQTLDADMTIVSPVYAVKFRAATANGSETPDLYGQLALAVAPLGTLANGTTNTVIEIDDTPDGEWAAIDADCTVTADTSYYKAGTKSLKLAFADTAAAGDGATNPLTAGDQDWSDDEYVGIWLYSDTVTSDGDLVLMITDGGTDETVSLPAVTVANTWQWARLDVSGIANNNKNVVTDLSIELSAAGEAALGSFNYYLDLGAKWDATDDVSLGQRVYYGGVVPIVQPVAAGAFASIAEYTDYFIDYSSTANLVPITDQSLNTGFAFVCYR